MPHPLAQAAAGHMACAAARLWSTRAFSCWIRPGCCSYVHPAHVITACRMSGVANHGGVHVRGRLPDGVWPTMITPLLDDERKSVDWEGLDSKHEEERGSVLECCHLSFLSTVLTEWFIRSGVAGLFSICLSSEMFHVSYTCSPDLNIISSSSSSSILPSPCSSVTRRGCRLLRELLIKQLVGFQWWQEVCPMNNK